MDAPSAEHRSISLRVGDAERQQCVTELLDHHLDGRLNTDEYERRERQALSAVTVDDLRRLTADLPTSGLASRSRPRGSNRVAQRAGSIRSPVRAPRDIRRLWPAAVLWSGAFVAQGGSTADWWHINEDITSGFVMASFGFATHWVITRFKN